MTEDKDGRKGGGGTHRKCQLHHIPAEIVIRETTGRKTVKEGRQEESEGRKEVQMKKGRPQRLSSMQQNIHRNTKEGKGNVRRRKVGREGQNRTGKGKGRIE
jgi:hypothetical protein